jgi:hypothetical protein
VVFFVGYEDKVSMMKETRWVIARQCGQNIAIIAQIMRACLVSTGIHNTHINRWIREIILVFGANSQRKETYDSLPLGSGMKSR